jgi:hypothetical protein
MRVPCRILQYFYSLLRTELGNSLRPDELRTPKKSAGCADSDTNLRAYGSHLDMTSTMSFDRPSHSRQENNVFHGCAKVAWISVVLSIGVNLFIQTTTHNYGSEWSRLIGGIFTLLLAIAGVVSGIVALCGIPRYGFRGLLLPALTGLCLWALLFAIAVPTFLKARAKALSQRRAVVLAPAVHSAGATRIQDAEMGFSFDLPDGYEAFPATAKPEGYRHAFLQRPDNEPNRVLLVKSLGGTLGRQRLKPEEIPAGKSVSLATFHWRGLEVDGIRVPEMAGELAYLTYNVQIPLRGKAIQLGFGGPASAESQLIALAEQVLSTLEGETNL